MGNIWEVLNSPAVVALIVSGVIYLLNRLYARRPTWQKYEGTLIAAVKFAEKSIPDDTTNKSLARLDAALQYVLKVFAEREGRQPTIEEAQEITEGIQIVHAELEASGNLDKAAPTEG